MNRISRCYRPDRLHQLLGAGSTSESSGSAGKVYAYAKSYRLSA